MYDQHWKTTQEVSRLTMTIQNPGIQFRAGEHEDDNFIRALAINDPPSLRSLPFSLLFFPLPGDTLRAPRRPFIVASLRRGHTQYSENSGKYGYGTHDHSRWAPSSYAETRLVLIMNNRVIS
jgi:hypothetical protein